MCDKETREKEYQRGFDDCYKKAIENLEPSLKNHNKRIKALEKTVGIREVEL